MTTAAEISATGLFDAEWYRRAYPDISSAGIEPAEHYVHYGQQEGRTPNAFFNEGFYRAKAGDIGQQLPLLHYARAGEAMDLPPSPHFDPAWYRRTYLLPRSGRALADFLRNRPSRQRLPHPGFFIPVHSAPWTDLPQDQDIFLAVLSAMSAGTAMDTEAAVIARSGLFDANHYLINGSDVHEASLDPIEHFCAFGWKEGRQPNIYFNTAWYVRTNEEVGRAGLNPLVHYILVGERAGRRPVVYFDPAWYRDRYGIPAGKLALAHFLENRRSQRYSPNRHFDLDFYLQRYFQQIGPNRDPFAHYLQTGTYKDIWPAPDFDPASIRKATMGRLSRHFTWRLHPDQDNPLIRRLHETYT